jgi:3-deoxy-manno-octulosonate cytidylyltransferase (CMP-KDO synthetase)
MKLKNNNMKIIGVIPARYKSTRFEGKPLADICGKPMIWWVYQQVRKAEKINEIYVATDDTRIMEVCERYSIKCCMTDNGHETSTERVNEVAHRVASDLYVCINGDEPLINPSIIDAIVPLKKPENDFFVANLMTRIKDPVEAIDSTNIKIVTDFENNALFMSRSPVPYPKSSISYQLYKHLGVLIYNIEALEFFADTPKGYNETVEDINELRFIEHGKKIKMIEVEAETLSVDTPKDLEKVRLIIENKFTPPI